MHAALIVSAPDIKARERKAGWRGCLAGALTVIACGLWAHYLTPAQADEPRAIPRALFSVGVWVCRNNEGLESVEAYPERANEYSIHCSDGAQFRDVRAKISS